jgi:hypothetical protein
LFFPDGTLPSRRWRPVVVLAAVNVTMLGALAALPDQTLSVLLGVRGLLHWRAVGEATWLETASGVAGLTVFGLALLALVVRYRNADDVGRRQLLWLLLGAHVMVVVFVINDVLQLNSFLGIYVIAGQSSAGDRSLACRRATLGRRRQRLAPGDRPQHPAP